MTYYDNPTPQRAARIAELNDRVRKHLPGTLPGSRVNLSYVLASSMQHDPEKGMAILKAVAKFDAWTEDNDPHGEHDYGRLEVAGEEIIFKFDYYDLSLQYGSENPDRPEETTRVLTIMYSQEY